MPHILVIAAILVLSLISTQLSVAAESVALRERVAMTTPVVRLGDVAKITSADRLRARQLAALPLMPAPSPGSERFLRRREVEDLLTAHGQDLGALHIAGAEQVAISGPAVASNAHSSAKPTSPNNAPMNLHAAILAGQTGRAAETRLDEATATALRNQLQQAIEAYLAAKTGKPGSWQVSCNIATTQLAQLRTATSPIACQGGREPWTGRQRFTVTFTTPQGAIKFPVYAEVSGGAVAVAVAVQPIERGAMITAADVELQQFAAAPPANSRRGPIDSIDKLIGMEARQAIEPGDMIFTDHVQAPVMVKRGEMITVVSQGGGIRVRTTARARQDGAKGDLVLVESADTRERFDVRVTGPREAAVFAATRSIATQPGEKPTSTARR